MIRIAGNGGVEDVVAALRAHPDDAQVQIFGCTALGNLAASNDANRSRIAEAGGIEAVVAALCAHPANAEVQDNACNALGNLAASNDANRSRIADARGIEAIVAALRAHPANAEVQSYGCYALGMLADAHPANRVRVAGAGGVEAAVTALRLHPESAQVQRFGCYALVNFNARPDKAKQVMTSQADDAEAVVVHAENAAMKENSCNTVGNLADAAMQTLEVEVATEKRTPQMEKQRRLDQRLARTSERLQLSPDADDDVAYQEALGDVAYKSVKDAMESLRGEVMAGLRDIEDALDDVDVDDETVILQNEVMTGMRSLDDTLGPLSGLSSPSSRSTEPCWDDAAPSDPSLDDSDRFGAGRAAVRESRRPSRKSC